MRSRIDLAGHKRGSCDAVRRRLCQRGEEVVCKVPTCRAQPPSPSKLLAVLRCAAARVLRIPGAQRANSLPQTPDGYWVNLRSRGVAVSLLEVATRSANQIH